MDTDFFRELERFSLLVRKRVSTAHIGSRRSIRFGHGISPVGYREYRKGDDFKLVDWKVYARTERLYVREHEEERSLLVHILLDSSGSMRFNRKFELASKIAAGFAFIAAQENEKFSVSTFAEELRAGEPVRGVGNLLKMIDLLDGTEPSGNTDILKASDQFDRMISTTSLVVLISDMLDDLDKVETAIYRLSRHDLIVVQILSPAERDLEVSGDARFIDMESGEALITRISQRLRDYYRSRLEAHNSRISEVCDSVGCSRFLFDSEMQVFDAFSEILRAGVLKI
ncbi:MAG TPA: DUF58 domain-containing protein [Methanothrix sp.]|nr:DUF58 domain-containing protein [Methanothrix sp.]HOK58959.1 DUF58 domain-containing protein [Methanothrix sp.]HOL44242.1 DUF58 domain-containing protein [Methanothrix sp.]HPO89220.1 DUF58 domain-containing protein [Methanothrix sp.]